MKRDLGDDGCIEENIRFYCASLPFPQTCLLDRPHHLLTCGSRHMLFPTTTFQYFVFCSAIVVEAGKFSTQTA